MASSRPNFSGPHSIAPPASPAIAIHRAAPSTRRRSCSAGCPRGSNPGHTPARAASSRHGPPAATAASARPRPRCMMKVENCLRWRRPHGLPSTATCSSGADDGLVGRAKAHSAVPTTSQIEATGCHSITAIITRITQKRMDVFGDQVAQSLSCLRYIRLRGNIRRGRRRSDHLLFGSVYLRSCGAHAHAIDRSGHRCQSARDGTTCLSPWSRPIRTSTGSKATRALWRSAGGARRHSWQATRSRAR